MSIRYCIHYFTQLVVAKGLTFSFTILLLLACLMPSLTLALDMKNMGTVAVLVTDESEEQRSKAIQDALAIVLVRLSGQSDILDSEATKEIFKQANSYILQFSYETLNHSDEYAALLKEDYLKSQQLKNSTNSTLPSSLKILKLTFGQQIILKKLQEAGQAVWDSNRPEVMLWWVSEEQAVRKILNEGELKESRTNFQYFAEQRGVPIKFPLMDLQDQDLINASDIWGGFGEPLVNANKRYGVTTWVQGKSYYSQGEWHAQWQISLLGENKSFKTQNQSLRAVQKTVIASIAKSLASEYAVVLGENATEIYINVSDVRNLDDFSKLKQYLDNLFVVEKVAMQQIKADQASFKLYLKEDVEKFKKLLTLDKKLHEVIEQNNLNKMENLPSVVINEQLSTAQAIEGGNADLIEKVEQTKSLAINYIQYRWAGK